MARVLMIGFEGADWTSDAGSGTFAAAYSTTSPHGGARCLSAQTASAAAGGATAPFSGGALARDYFARVYIKKSANVANAAGVLIMRATTGGRQAEVRLNTNGTLNLLDANAAVIGSASAALNDNQWYCIELRAQVNTATTGVTELRVDGVTVTGTNVANANLGTLTPGQVSVGWMITGVTSTATVFFDDLALNDGTGTAQNTWCGEGKIVHLLPTGDNAVGTGWTLGTGTAIAGGSGSTAVKNVPPVGVADLTAGSDTKQIRNASSNANVAYNATLQTYTVAGLVSTDTIQCMHAVALTGAPVATSAKSGSMRILLNPVDPGLVSIGTFYQGSTVAGTYPSGWQLKVGTIYDTSNANVAAMTSANYGTAPVVSINQVTASTRIAMVCNLYLRVEYQPVTSGPADLVGSAAGTGASSGSFTAQPQLSGSSAGAGATTGQTTITQNLSGSSAGVGATTGTVTIPALLSGSSPGVGTTAGNLKAQPQLSGSAAGVGTETGALTASPQLSGSSAGVGTTAGAATASPRLSGFSAGVGTTSGQTTITQNLSGSSAGTGTTSGAASASPQLSGTSAGTGATTGTVSIPASSANISGTAAGTGATTGALSVSPNISGSAAGTGTSTGVVSVSPRISGTSAGIGTATGALTATSLLSGAATGLGSTTGALTATSKLSGIAAGVGATTGTPNTTAQLSGSSPGVGTTAGNLTVPGLASLSGTAAGSGIASGSVTASPRITGSSAGTSTATGSLTASSQLSGSSAGVGNTTGALKTQPQLSGSASGTGTTTGALRTAIQLVGSSTGVGAASGSLSIPAPISGSAFGIGGAFGNLVALPTARPVYPLNTSGYIETADSGFVRRNAKTGIVEEPTTGNVR